MEFRHQRELALKVAGDRDIAILRALHTDGTASVGYINRFLLHGSEFLFFKRKKSPLHVKRGFFSFEEQELTTMQKKSIYVAYTGGTIGMQRS
ncbi:hypothetical protein BJP35_0454 [Enterobacter sp. J49]|nr:hypothetical protein BJP35_0454 [Enterobacter sp. J49]